MTRSGCSMKRGGRLFGIPALLLYTISVTFLALFSGSPERSLVLLAFPGMPGILLALRRYGILVLFLALALVGTSLNLLLLFNHGDPVLTLGPLTVREGAWTRIVSLNTRILVIAGAGLFFSSLIHPAEAVRALRDMGLPRGFAFSLALSIRLLPLARRDLEWILHSRRLRGYRRAPVTPGDYKTILFPLLNVMIERAYWIGVASEMRGFSLWRPRERHIDASPLDPLLMVLLVFQAAYIAGLLG
ncbi:MAG: energy-coupling factor transporter transmembrane protein EcfT [Desulfurococcales archaeon]|nr:energy-coupling factor transporter transmembrane protein EcfT [Desulfurococcales archaeon]